MSQPELTFGSSDRAATSSVKSQEPGGIPRQDGEFAMNYCPRCSMRLAARSCKLMCPGCGYYMSCSDFY